MADTIPFRGASEVPPLIYVLNLLPIPLLDGGHLLYYAVEIIKGSPLSDRTLQIGQQAGMFVLAALMALALYNDLFRLLPRIFS